MTSLDDAMLNPSACFRRPQDVLAESWTAEQKYQVLRQWKYDIGQLQVATEENMAVADTKPDVISLAEIHAAMETIGYDPESDPVPTKGA